MILIFCDSKYFSHECEQMWFVKT